MRHTEPAHRGARLIPASMLFVAVLIGCSSEPSPEALQAETDHQQVADAVARVEEITLNPIRPSGGTVNPDITIEYVMDGVPGLQTSYEQAPVETQEWVDDAGAGLCGELFDIITDLDGPTTWQAFAQSMWDQMAPEIQLFYDDDPDVFAQFAERTAERNCTETNEMFVDGSGRRAYEDGFNQAIDAAG